MRGDSLAGKDPVLIDDEIKQEIKLLWRSIQQRIVDTRFKGVGIEADLVEFYDAGASQVLPAIHRPDPGMQLRQMKWLRDIIIGSFLQPDDLVIQRIFGGNDQDIAFLVLAADEVQQADTAAVWQP